MHIFTHLVIDELDIDDLKAFRDRFSIPISDEDIDKVPYYRPAEDSEELRYMKERRKELVKQVSRAAEDHKVGVRDARREALAMLKDLENSGDIPADDRRREEKAIQKLTDDHVKQIDDMVSAKEEEILQV